MRISFSVLVCMILITACGPVDFPPASGGDQPVNAPTPIETDLPIDLLPTREAPVVTLPTLDPGLIKTPAVDMPPSPYNPKPEDKTLERSTVQMDYIGLLIMESYPVQISLEIQGYLPTPCHALRVSVVPPDEQNRIYGEIYSVVDPSMMCIQVIKEIETSVNLGSFPPGHYSVYINGELIGEFDS